MKPRFSTIVGPVLGLLLAATVPLTGCEGFQFQWVAIEDSVTLYSLARTEYMAQPGAYDFYSRTPVVVEETYRGDPEIFDMALSEQAGELVLLPAGLFATLDINPGIAMDSSGTTFEELAKAPRDGYVTDSPVPVRTDVIYTVRTRTDRSGCSRYGKFQILEADPQGVLTFRQIRNNLCNDRELIPPEED
jgi:hypothetical protein